MTLAEKLVTVAENEPKVFDAGKQAEYDAFWDKFQQNGERNHYQYTFYSSTGWNDELFKPKYDFKIRYATNTFSNAKMTQIDKNIIFQQDCSTVTGFFLNNSTIKTIKKIITHENVTYGRWFEGCIALEDVTFSGVIGNNIDFSACSNLSYGSIKSVIDTLSDTSHGKTVTFSETAVNKAYASASLVKGGMELFRTYNYGTYASSDVLYNKYTCTFDGDLPGAYGGVHIYNLDGTYVGYIYFDGTNGGEVNYGRQSPTPSNLIEQLQGYNAENPEESQFEFYVCNTPNLTKAELMQKTTDGFYKNILGSGKENWTISLV